jgi:PAS domain S-box-containing protein
MPENEHPLISPSRFSQNKIFYDLERLANRSRDGIYHYDIDSRRFLFMNDRFKAFFGFSSDVEAPASSDRIIKSIHPEDRSAVLNALRETIAGGQREGEAEYRVQYPDRSVRWLHDRWIVLHDSESRPVAIEGFIRDNTERRISELQFIQSTQRALIGSYILQDRKFRYVNPEFLRITGYTSEELLGTDPLTIVEEDYRQHVKQSAVAMLKGQNNMPYEFCIRDKLGATHWIMETVTSVLYGGRVATMGYFMDISKLREIQGNLSTLGLMVGTISHSLRGCLTGLNASLYLIETGFYRNKPAQIEEGLDVTKLMADRIRKLIFDILYYAKKRDLETEKVDVWQFVKEVAITVETRIRAANIEFITDFPYDSGSMVVDTDMIRAALINILENAMEACIEDRRAIHHQIKFVTRVDANQIRFKITDNGPGMGKEQQSKIFQLFSSSKGKRGTGIGLFVTRKAILKHGGDITVDSESGEGTVFRIALPRQAAKKPAAKIK